MGAAEEGTAATTSGAAEVAEPGVGALPGVVRAGATLSVLAVLAAVALALIPVSATVPDDLDGAPTSLACGSVLRPAGDDALADEPRDIGEGAVACGSARTVRMGWAGMALAGSVISLAFSLLMGDGMAARPTRRESTAAPPS